MNLDARKYVILVFIILVGCVYLVRLFFMQVVDDTWKLRCTTVYVLHCSALLLFLALYGTTAGFAEARYVFVTLLLPWNSNQPTNQATH